MSSNYSTIINVINTKFKVDNLNVLIEPQVMSVVLTGHPKNTPLTLYRFDPNKENIFPFFEKGMELRIICDYILLADYNEVLYVLLIELKKGNEPAKKQLNATEEFMLYIIASALRIKKEIDRDKIYIRKIRISECRRTRKTKIGNIEYDENNYIDYPWSELHIRALLK